MFLLRPTSQASILLFHFFLNALPYIFQLIWTFPSSGYQNIFRTWLIYYTLAYGISCGTWLWSQSLCKSPAIQNCFFCEILDNSCKSAVLSCGPLVNMWVDMENIDSTSISYMNFSCFMATLKLSSFLFPKTKYYWGAPCLLFLLSSGNLMTQASGPSLMCSLFVILYCTYILNSSVEDANISKNHLNAMPISLFVMKDNNLVFPLGKNAERLLEESGHLSTAQLFDNTILVRSKKKLIDFLLIAKREQKTTVESIEIKDKLAKNTYNVLIYPLPNCATGIAFIGTKCSERIHHIFRTKFIRSLTHEFFTPLNALLPVLSLLQETYKEEEPLKIALANAELMYCKACDFVDFTKLEMDELDHEIKSFELSVLFDELHRIFRYEAESKDNKLAFMILSRSPVFMAADYKRIKQILVKLISNAIKFTKNGLVQVSALVKPNTLGIQFKVQDSGIGMSPEQVKWLFSPLSRETFLVSPLHGVRGLAGIGTVIAQKLCESLGSRLEVETERKKGTTVTFKLENCMLASEWCVGEEIKKNVRQPRKKSMAGTPKVYYVTPNKNIKKRSRSKSKEIGYMVGSCFEGGNANKKHSGFKEVEDWNDVEIPEEYKEGHSIQTAFILNVHRCSRESESLPRGLASTEDLMNQSQPVLPLVFPVRHNSHRKLDTEIGSTFKRKPSRSPKYHSANNTPSSIKLPAAEGFPSPVVKCPLLNLSEMKQQEQPKVDPYTPLDISEAGSPNRTVLIADDGGGNRYVLKAMLKKLNVETKEAVDGEEAFEIIKRSFENKEEPEIGLILMDLDMPKLDGIQATRKIRNLEYKMRKELEIPIVAVTAFDTDADKAACFEARMQSFLTKPVTFYKIKEIIDTYLQLTPICSLHQTMSIHRQRNVQ
eukprot:TRINITY_DN71205_c4_g1_i1.p1 TRINITY_DN71205_c4_g1~~TRINITY_DN71205_c4_g1_i1.p1  ORF type:complete len:932 (-),score=53.05 TRINITY_DN71205_c4_g1_i1:6266-8920(-)